MLYDPDSLQKDVLKLSRDDCTFALCLTQHLHPQPPSPPRGAVAPPDPVGASSANPKPSANSSKKKKMIVRERVLRRLKLQTAVREEQDSSTGEEAALYRDRDKGMLGVQAVFSVVVVAVSPL